MTEPLAYLNGQFLPASAAVIPVTDAGFMQGVTVAEQLRTFGGQLFRLDRHLQRLERSLAIVGVHPPQSSAQLAAIASELAMTNHALLDPADDLGLSIFITPGIYPTFATLGATQRPMVGMHTYPLPFHSWWEKYERGESLTVTEVRQVPTHCWPAELKCRSRMHYFLADRRARELAPGSRALLLDEQGFVTEASTANLLVLYRDVGLVSPPQEKILPGISGAVLAELAGGLKIPLSYRELTVDDVAAADEVLLCSTSPCVWPVTQLNGQPIAGGQRGPIAAQLLAAWSQHVGLDIAGQAFRFARR